MDIDAADLGEISKQLDAIHLELERQNSYWHMLVRGIYYGVGFVVGSVVLAAILIGIFLPLVKDIPGIQQAFQSGASIIQQAGHSASSTR